MTPAREENRPEACPSPVANPQPTLPGLNRTLLPELALLIGPDSKLEPRSPVLPELELISASLEFLKSDDWSRVSKSCPRL